MGAARSPKGRLCWPFERKAGVHGAWPLSPAPGEGGTIHTLPQTPVRKLSCVCAMSEPLRPTRKGSLHRGKLGTAAGSHTWLGFGLRTSPLCRCEREGEDSVCTDGAAARHAALAYLSPPGRHPEPLLLGFSLFCCSSVNLILWFSLFPPLWQHEESSKWAKPASGGNPPVSGLLWPLQNVPSGSPWTLLAASSTWEQAQGWIRALAQLSRL